MTDERRESDAIAADITAKQSALDAQIIAFQLVDLAKPRAIVRWLRGMYPNAARRGVMCNFGGVVAALRDAGYEANIYVSRKDESPEEWFARVELDGARRWLIGQAIDYMKDDHGPPYEVERFAVELRLDEDGVE